MKRSQVRTSRSPSIPRQAALPTTGSRDAVLLAGLLLLALVPVLAGMLRLAALASADTAPDNARFLVMPTPVASHVICSLAFAVLGAFQFAPRWRHRRPRWHVQAGRVAALAGLGSAGSGLWLSLNISAGPYDTVELMHVRTAVAVAMFGSIVIALYAISRRAISAHQAWMMRAYALGMGAGTQVLTHIPWFLVASWHTETGRTICMTAGWLLNWLVAEWLIARQRRNPVHAGVRPSRSLPTST